VTKALFNPEGTRTVMRVMKRLDPAAAERAKRRLQAAEDLDAWRITRGAERLRPPCDEADLTNGDQRA